MIATLTQGTKGPIGCFFDDDSVRLIQLKPTRNGPPSVVQSACRFTEQATAASHEARLDALKQAVSHGDFVGRRAVTCMPADQATYQRLRLPVMPRSELSEAVHWQLARDLSCHPDALCTASYDIGEVSTAKNKYLEVISVAVKMADIEAHVAILNEAGLIVDAVDTRPAALARCLGDHQSSEHARSALLVVEFHPARTILLVFRDGRPCFVRSVAGGLKQINTHVTQQLGLSDAADDNQRSIEPGGDERTQDAFQVAARAGVRVIANELLMCTHYLAEFGHGEFQPHRGTVIGAGHLNELLVQELNGAAEIEFRPFEHCCVPAIRDVKLVLDGDTTLDDWLPPVGLSLYGVEQLLGKVAA